MGRNALPPRRSDGRICLLPRRRIIVLLPLFSNTSLLQSKPGNIRAKQTHQECPSIFLSTTCHSKMFANLAFYFQAVFTSLKHLLRLTKPGILIVAEPYTVLIFNKYTGHFYHHTVLSSNLVPVYALSETDSLLLYRTLGGEVHTVRSPESTFMFIPIRDKGRFRFLAQQFRSGGVDVVKGSM